MANVNQNVNISIPGVVGARTALRELREIGDAAAFAAQQVERLTQSLIETERGGGALTQARSQMNAFGTTARTTAMSVPDNN